MTDLGKENQANPEKSSLFGGPEHLRLDAANPRGPMTRQGSSPVKISTATVTLRFHGEQPTALQPPSIDPVRAVDAGVDADARLKVTTRDDILSRPLDPGEGLRLQIEGEGRLPPGCYASALRIADKNGRPLLAIPIELNVSAHSLWPTAMTLLGVAFLGLLALLAERATLNQRIAEALTVQQRLGELLDLYPPSAAENPLIAQAKDGLGIALAILSRPRPWGLEDRRVPQADRYLAQAREATTVLRERNALSTPGRAAVGALDERWRDLQDRAKASQALEPPRDATAPGLAAALLDVQRSQWRSQLGPLLAGIEHGLRPQVERARRALTSGEDERARQLARTVDRWLRQAARELDQRGNFLLALRYYSADMLRRQAAYQRLLAAPSTPSSGRRALAAGLSGAGRALADQPNLEGFRVAHLRLQEAETQLVAARSQSLLEQYQAAMEATERASAIIHIEAAIENLAPAESDELKAQQLLGITALWREHLTAVDEAETHELLLGLIEQLEQHFRSFDFEGAIAKHQKLTESWLAYEQRQISDAGSQVMEPYCNRVAGSLRAQRQASSGFFALLEPTPAIADVEADLERIADELQQDFSGHDCLDSVLAISQRLLDLDSLLFSAMVSASPLPPETLLGVVKGSEDAEAIALARRLMSEPRPLTLTPRTASEDVQVDRQVVLEVAGLGPTWGLGTLLIVDFGDGSDRLTVTADELRREPLLRHRYTQPGRLRVRLLAAKRLAAGTSRPEPAGELLGEGELNLVVGPSRASFFQTVAAVFLGLRFLLASAIGLLLQGWRLVGERPFGSRRRDYLEAFALGAGALGGVEGLSSLLSRLLTGG